MCNYFLLSEKDCFLTHPAVIVEASHIPVCLIAFHEDVSVLCFHFERFLKLAFCTNLKIQFALCLFQQFHVSSETVYCMNKI